MQTRELLVIGHERGSTHKLTLSIDLEIYREFCKKFPNINISRSVEAFFEDCMLDENGEFQEIDLGEIRNADKESERDC